MARLVAAPSVKFTVGGVDADHHDGECGTAAAGLTPPLAPLSPAAPTAPEAAARQD
uniref:Uncharacterized protein n=1 Tax=Aegilops tauschii TaxID=37682 RepID=M8CAV6_AEGTA